VRAFLRGVFVSSTDSRKVARRTRGRPELPPTDRDTLRIPTELRKHVKSYQRSRKQSLNAIYVEAIAFWWDWRSQVWLLLPKGLRKQTVGYMNATKLSLSKVFSEAIRFWLERQAQASHVERPQRKVRGRTLVDLGKRDLGADGNARKGGHPSRSKARKRIL
jgi:hypothetical protein